MPATTIRARPEPPYDFRLTAEYATYNSERHGADFLRGGTLSRALATDGGETVLASIRSVGETDAPELEIRIAGAELDAAALDRTVDAALRLAGARTALRPFYAALAPDDPMSAFARRLRGLALPLTPTPFEGLILAILGQQISNHVARVLRDLLVDTFGESVIIDGETRTAFPSPAALASAGADALRAIKFSARKAEYICDISSQVADGSLDLDAIGALPSEDAVERLTALRGVGPWTAHWLLVRSYGHPDGFPAGDLAIQRNLGILYGDGSRMTESAALAASERWRPHRSLATTYLFAAARLGMIDSKQGHVHGNQARIASDKSPLRAPAPVIPAKAGIQN